MAAMVNEGALILQEGIAENADAIDVVKMLGYGFPRWRGGPMFWARETGLGTVRDAMARVVEQSPGSWRVADMLR
jgi:3-hydroxyacyl-CoA dehydrogenase